MQPKGVNKFRGNNLEKAQSMKVPMCLPSYSSLLTTIESSLTLTIYDTSIRIFAKTKLQVNGYWLLIEFQCPCRMPEVTLNKEKMLEGTFFKYCYLLFFAKFR